MLTALVLICAIGPGTDLTRCDQESASDVLVIPQSFAAPSACFFAGQAYLAGSAIGRFDTRIYQAKIVCMPEEAGKEIARSRRTKPKVRGVS
jgi:hypothetical protein